ncbi:MAG: MAPEG family protein [Paludibacterium sp.]|uniref:MAPEG family protein n=1 Tax=Paludibacterium sp. TaxID=1917523 RepID=UPI0025FFE9D5|nr:MAPEG family protein [Paludibacterium sp.]MBV8049497.1 MAPEG family protein [Paludibacterium sp.]MBV8646242.1 MAPEG family protein [Paludibacterium sp.]
MPFALWSILIAAFLPLVWVGVAKFGAPYDNSRPRDTLAQATGYRQRANWAQQNAWEAFAPYAAAVIVAYVMKVPPALLNAAAGVFLLARVAHGLCYVANLSTPRSLCWAIGVGCVVYLFVMAGMR